MRREVVRAVFDRPIAHRGLHAPGGPVENTLAAARAAMDAGYGIECDVQLSRDRQAMVCHDDKLDRLAGIDAALVELRVADLARVRLADGSTVPTLAALLRLIGGRAPLVIELKGSDPRLADAVRAEIAGYAGPLVLEGFEPLMIACCADAPCPVGLVGPSREGDGIAAAALLPRCDFLSWRVDDLDEAVDRRPDLPLSTWTVRTPQHRAAAARAGAQIVFEGFRP